MNMPSEVTVTTWPRVSCLIHPGEHAAYLVCDHVRAGAAIAHDRPPCPKLPGMLLCRFCSQATFEGEWKMACECCVNYHLRPLHPEPGQEPVGIERAHQMGQRAFGEAWVRGRIPIARNPFPAGSDDSWAWDSGWRMMVHTVGRGLGVKI